MKRMLRQDSLFFLLLVISAIGHWMIGYLGGEEVTAPALWDFERGKATVSVQLVAAEDPPLLEHVEPLEPAQPESLGRVDQLVEMPRAESPEVEPMEPLHDPIKRLVDQQYPPEIDPMLIERDADFQLPPAAMIEIPSLVDQQEVPEAQSAAIDIRPEPVRFQVQKLAKNDPVQDAQKVPIDISRTDQPVPEPKSQPLPLPRQQDLPQPETHHTVKLPKNATRTVLSRGSTGKEVPPSKNYCPLPEYPVELNNRGIGGRVMLSVQVSATGTVLSVKVETSSGYPLLDEYAIRGVQKWRFNPGRQGGRPMPMTVLAPVVFQPVRSP